MSDDSSTDRPVNGYGGQSERKTEKYNGKHHRDTNVTAGIDEGHTVGAGRLAAVPLEELIYHANEQRRKYDMHSIKSGGKARNRWFKFFDNDFGPQHPDNVLIESNNPNARLTQAENEQIAARAEFEADKADARRRLRTASWGMMFYLITTDVIGPFNAPYAFSTVGFVGGILLYLTFGVAAYYSSFLVLNLYLRVDSDRYPVQSYGELMECFFGVWGNYIVSIVQVVQILFVVGSNVIANAQSMTELTQPHGPLCFVVSIIIWTAIGFIISVPFRSLAKLSFLASFNVFINLIIIFISMGFIAHSAPNYYSASQAYGFKPPYAPVELSATGVGALSNQVNGAMNMVFGWSGIMIFVEFMNEMRKPFEFVKSFTFAEMLVFCVYIVYGCYVYGLQGQYTLPVAFQGVSKYSWQSVGNGLSLWTYTMASVTYLNIAVKVLYWFIFGNLFRGPPLMSKMGFIYWTVLQLAAWIISFIIGTAIPQVQTIQALVGAACLLQFSYTWPPLMQLAYDVYADASKGDGVWHPLNGPAYRDSWRSLSRWRRGLFTGKVWFKAINFLYFLAALATCGLGIWGSVLTIQSTFAHSPATSFGCNAPV